MMRRLKGLSSKSAHLDNDNISTSSITTAGRARSFLWSSSSKPLNTLKTLKTYSRKKHVRTVLEEKTNSIFTGNTERVSLYDENPEPPSEPTIKATKVKSIANKNGKHRDQSDTWREPKVRTRLLHGKRKAMSARLDDVIREDTELKARHEREAVLVKREAEDKAIAENDRAEREFEAKRLRLYKDLWEAQGQGWVMQEVQVREILGASRNGVSYKRCKMDVEAMENAIRSLIINRERAWWIYYQSVEGLSTEEKEQMRRIKRKQLRNPNYDEGMGNSSHRILRQDPTECLYCEDDDCDGC